MGGEWYMLCGMSCAACRARHVVRHGVLDVVRHGVVCNNN